MTNRPQEQVRVTPRKSRVDTQYEALAGRLSVKGRAALTRHDELCEADPAQNFGALWKRLAGGLGALAPHANEMAGQQAVKFYIPDGKYRQQVFALEHTADSIVLYMPDIVARAVAKKILAAGGADNTYKIVGDNALQLSLEHITAETQDITVCKAMLGWGKCAVRTSLTVNSKEKQIKIVEQLCELAAESWVNAPAVAAATP